MQVIPGVEVTVGSSDDPAAEAVNAMGGKHIAKEVTVSLLMDLHCVYFIRNENKRMNVGIDPALLDSLI